MQAQTIMRTDYAYVQPEDSVLRAAQLLVEHRLYAMPVVGGDQRLRGMLNAMDIIGLSLPTYLDEMEDLRFLPGSFELPVTALPDLRALTVGELCATREGRHRPDCGPMEPPPQVSEDESFLEVARLFVREGAWKCAVVREGRVVGMIDPQDLLVALLARWEREAAQP
jgi:CBS domain-containing protein